MFGAPLSGLTPRDQLKIILYAMKKDIHPPYYNKAVVICSCGAKHVLGSTKEKMSVEICSKCHPFYTGKEKLVDTAGRVEKFKSRRKKAEEKKATKPKTKKTTAKKTAGTKGTTAKKPIAAKKVTKKPVPKKKVKK